jgi:hypothetical protein
MVDITHDSIWVLGVNGEIINKLKSLQKANDVLLYFLKTYELNASGLKLQNGRPTKLQNNEIFEKIIFDRFGLNRESNRFCLNLESGL